MCCIAIGLSSELAPLADMGAGWGYETVFVSIIEEFIAVEDCKIEA
jgi:hypothetical protein